MPIILNDFPTGQIFPEHFPVYIRNSQTTNAPTPGAIEKYLPTNNQYNHNPGCYIACYRKNSGLYLVEKNIYVVGQIRVKGLYSKKTNLCQPLMQENFDFSHSEKYNNLCNQSFPACDQAQCWAGGDTIGWYQAQKNNANLLF